MSNKLEQLEFKLEKIIGIYKHAGKIRKNILPSSWSHFHLPGIHLSLLHLNSDSEHWR